MAIRCENCGHEAPTDDRFCSKCGASLPIVETPEEVASEPEDASWVALAGDAAPVAPTPVESEPDPDPEPNPEHEPIVAAALPSPSAQSMDSESDPAPREKRRDKGLWIAVVAVGIVGALAIVVWTMNWAGGGNADDGAEIAAETDDPVSPVDEWQSGYTDTFLSEGDITLVTGAEARLRDYPTTEGSAVQRTLAANSSVTGRWVRGRDPATKWLKVAGGGYIWEGNLATPSGEGSPIAIAFSSTNPDFGPEVEIYLDRARAQARADYDRIDRLPEKEREAALNSIEGRSTFTRVPGRRWRGLTVTAVAQHYEAHSIYFREDAATVRRAFVAAGVRVDADGSIELPDEPAITCSIDTNQWADSRPYGTTALTCGV